MLQLQRLNISGLQRVTLLSVIIHHSGLGYAALTNNPKQWWFVETRVCFLLVLHGHNQPVLHALSPHPETQAGKAAKCFRSPRQRGREHLKVLKQRSACGMSAHNSLAGPRHMDPPHHKGPSK